MITPASTYRVQLNKDFTFRHLKDIIPYLHDLGVTTIYAAPIFSATPGSTHGYDVTDPHSINPEIGTEDELHEIANMLHGRGMTWLQDIVPNHMAFVTENKRLMDVLERRENSPYYNYFDIDWKHHDPDFNGKLMVPFLGKPIADCLSERELALNISNDGITLDYFDTKYPASLPTYEMLAEHLRALDFSVDVAVNALSTASKSTSLKEWGNMRRAFMAHLVSNPAIWQAVQDWEMFVNVNAIKLQDVLNRQFYVLTYWKDTEHKLNYRRFFTVNSLICLAMESNDVFTEFHRYLHELYDKKCIHGLRIDHIDGLKDPSTYIRRLRGLFGNDCYIIAEKILESKEEIPEHWSLEGTSGYEFLSIVNQLFTDRQGASDLVNFYNTLVPDMLPYGELVLKNKKLILEEHMSGELENLTHYFTYLRLQGELTHEQIEHTLSALMLSWPVYRIYPEHTPLDGANLKLLNEAFTRAYDLTPALWHELDYMRDLFTLKEADDPRAKNVIIFLKRMMQFTGPLTAKGVEDTTFYIYNPLISHVEVGDAPSTLGISVRSFHKRMLNRMSTIPQSLNATATHDTKRGEDARLRLNLLTEVPEKWMQHVEKWQRVNRPFVKTLGGQRAPSVNDEYFIYQSMLGGFPDDFVISENWIGRLQEYMVKVVREAKVISNWSEPNLDYEEVCSKFIHDVLTESHGFLGDFVPFVKDLGREAEVYSIAQLLVKITAPGVPDIYQGTELFDLSYVDPDNRRPVDFEKRSQMLAEFRRQSHNSFAEFSVWLKHHASTGVRKLFTTFRMLNFRKEHPDLFEKGDYIPVECAGSILAYARNFENEWLIVVVPLGIAGRHRRKEEFPDIFISLPGEFPKQWDNIITSESVTSDQGFSLGKATEHFPIIALYSKALL